jgi:hypothetical protein
MPFHTAHIESKLQGTHVPNNLIPLFSIILLGHVMLFVVPIGPAFVARMNLGVTALLTAILLSIVRSCVSTVFFLVAIVIFVYLYA